MRVIVGVGSDGMVGEGSGFVVAIGCVLKEGNGVTEGGSIGEGLHPHKRMDSIALVVKSNP